MKTLIDPNEKRGTFKQALRVLAFSLALVMIWQIASPSALRVIAALAEEGSPLSTIYGLLSDNAGEPETAQDYYELANISIGQRQYEKGLSELETARSLADPQDVVFIGELWLKTASVLALLGRMDESKAALDEAIACDPQSAQALILRAQMAIEDGNYPAAIADLTSYLVIVPTDSSSRLTLAQLYEGTGAYGAAAETYMTLYEQLPQDESYWLNAMRCWFLGGAYETTLAQTQTYIDLHADQTADQYGGIAYYLYAASLMQLTRYAEAADGFDAAMAMGYDRGSCLEQITLCRFETGEHQRVIDAGCELLGLTQATGGEAGYVVSSPDLVFQRMGVSYMRLGDYENALAMLERSKEVNPGLVGNDYYRGVCLLSLGRYEEAAAAFTESIEAGYLLQYCYYNRGVCYVQLLEYEKAIEDMGMTLQSGDDPELIAAAKDILWQLAAYYEQQEAGNTMP